MSELGNKAVFSANLSYYLEIREKSQKELAQHLGISQASVTDWVKMRTYPRMDKLQLTAEFLGESGYTFSNNATVVSGTVYYFKVEPIRWRILSNDGETAFILCDSIIADMSYQSNYIYDSASDEAYTPANGAPSGTYANNYKYSEVRRWLNETFYETAFTSLQQEIIITTTVDNSVYSTGFSPNPYACEDTEDKVFFLSYREVTNSAYGFTSSFTTSDNSYDTARRMQTSDYSRAMGAIMNTSSAYYGNGFWWLRSPYIYCSYTASCVGYGGYHAHCDVYNHYYVNSGSCGVVPAMWINLNP